MFCASTADGGGGLALSPDRPTLSGLASCFSAFPPYLLLRERGRSVSASPLLTFFYAPPLFTSILHAFPEKSKTLFHSELASMRRAKGKPLTLESFLPRYRLTRANGKLITRLSFFSSSPSCLYSARDPARHSVLLSRAVCGGRGKKTR